MMGGDAATAAAAAAAAETAAGNQELLSDWTPIVYRYLEEMYLIPLDPSADEDAAQEQLREDAWPAVVQAINQLQLPSIAPTVVADLPRHVVEAVRAALLAAKLADASYGSDDSAGELEDSEC
jgi:hypothetical protein